MVRYGAAPGEIKDVNKSKRQVIGYPSTFGHLDSMHEIVDAGAFKRTIEQWGPEGRNRIKTLYQHDPAWIVGRPIEMVEDEIGLRTVTQMADTAMGRDTFRLIEEGIVTEQSIGYDVIKDTTDEENVRHLKELRLWEYSFVTWGANEHTPIVGTKADGIAILQSKMERMKRLLKSGRFDSDDIPLAMELAVTQWQDTLKSMESHDTKGDDTDAKPIGPFANWDECIATMTGRVDDPEAFCGALESGKMLTVALHTPDSPDGTPKADVDSPLKDISDWARVRRLKHDLQSIAEGFKK